MNGPHEGGRLEGLAVEERLVGDVHWVDTSESVRGEGSKKAPRTDGAEAAAAKLSELVDAEHLDVGDGATDGLRRGQESDSRSSEKEDHSLTLQYSSSSTVWTFSSPIPASISPEMMAPETFTATTAGQPLIPWT